MSAGAKTAEPEGEAPERILGEDGARAYRNFLDWSTGAGFALAVLEVTEPRRRAELVAWTRARVPGTEVVALDEASGRPLRPVLERACAEPGTAVLVLTRIEEARERGTLLRRLNVQRDELVRDFAMPWVILIHPAAALELQMHAPDLASFAGLWLREEGGAEEVVGIGHAEGPRLEASGMHAAEGGAEGLLGEALDAITLSHLDEAADLLAQYDLAHPEARSSDAERIRLGGLLAWRRGEPAEALDLLAKALHLAGAAGNARLEAILWIELGDVHKARDAWELALDLYRKALEVFGRLGDVRARAVTMGRVADILQVRGELDEALRIHREELLPAFEQLGALRERAVTMGRVADILLARGELDEALRICREEALPVYEQLGDMRSRAVTLGRVANILQARGELDEALRIYREEALPVYEKLGDVRARAGTLGNVADILQVRGELEEALRIYREELLPVFEQLGALRERAVTMGRVADILLARGELDEALRIRREEELPVYEQLGDVRSLLIGRAHLAANFLARDQPGDGEAARDLLRLALQAAEALRLPEAARIRALQQHFDLEPPS